MSNSLRVGLSYAPQRAPYTNYHRAVHAAGERAGVALETIDLSADPAAVATVDGILFTGGADIDPGAYGKPEYAPLCGRLDPSRDALERSVYGTAVERKLPILAICRGAQLIDVLEGGTLIPDLPDVKAVRHGQIGGDDGIHPVIAEDGSRLATLAGSTAGEVNSSHHQAVERIAPVFTVTARADDGTIEAFEWAQPAGKPYLLAVQWHPERMQAGAPFSQPLFDDFLAAVRVYEQAAE